QPGGLGRQAQLVRAELAPGGRGRRCWIRYTSWSYAARSHQRGPFQMRLSVPVRGGLVALCIVLLGLAGCHAHRVRDEKKVTPEALYKKAHKAMESYDFNGAIKNYEALTARFPFTDEARQARLDLIYAYYRAGEKESATDAAETFIRENPTHPRV